jgi:hypothetical protein
VLLASILWRQTAEPAGSLAPYLWCIPWLNLWHHHTLVPGRWDADCCLLCHDVQPAAALHIAASTLRAGRSLALEGTAHCRVRCHGCSWCES